jgi:hypothetical protein
VCQLTVELQHLRAVAALERRSRGRVEEVALEALRQAVEDIRNLLGLTVLSFCCFAVQ